MIRDLLQLESPAPRIRLGRKGSGSQSRGEGLPTIGYRGGHVNREKVGKLLLQLHIGTKSVLQGGAPFVVRDIKRNPGGGGKESKTKVRNSCGPKDRGMNTYLGNPWFGGKSSSLQDEPACIKERDENPEESASGERSRERRRIRNGSKPQLRVRLGGY